MKTFFTLLTALLLGPSAFAVTLAVLPGEAIQPKVDAAAPGDIVAIFGGTYAADVTITKAIRLVEVDGQDVTITGNVTWTGVTNAPPFEGFTVGSSGKGITVTNTTGLVIKNVDARGGFGISVSGNSKTDIVGGYASKISQDGGELNVTLTVMTGNFETTGNSLKTVAFRTNCAGSVKWNSKKSWFGYSKARGVQFAGSNSTAIVVGAEINHGGDYGDGVGLYGTNNRYYIVNNVIKNVYYYTWAIYYIANAGTGVRIYSGNQSLIANNYIHLYTDHDDWEYQFGDCIHADDSNPKILNNILEGGQAIMTAPFGTVARNNLYYRNTWHTDRGGVLSEGTIVGNPAFIVNAAPLLLATSPCINAGVSDPIFNDLDGTRNDIGPGGGCLFDPQGSTTNKPVVISFDLAPQQLLRGVDTQVNVSNGEAVAQP